MGNVHHKSKSSVLTPITPRWCEAELEQLFCLYVTTRGQTAFWKYIHYGGGQKFDLKQMEKWRVMPTSIMDDVPLGLKAYLEACLSCALRESLPFTNFANILCTWVHPECLQLESLILERFLNTLMKNDTKNQCSLLETELLVLQQFLHFSCLLYYYSFFPEHPSLQHSGSQQHSFSDTRSSALPSLDSGDMGTLLKGFTAYRTNHSTQDSVTSITEWSTTVMSFLTLTLTQGLRTVVFKRTKVDGKQRESAESQKKGTIDTWGMLFMDPSRCISEDFHFIFNNMTPAFKKQRWRCLYATWRDGQSMNRLIQSMLYYPQVSLVVIKTADGHIFGACINCPWKSTNGKYFGSIDTFLWTYKPQLDIFRTSGMSTNFMYINNKSEHCPKGIGFGGQVERFRLWVDDNLCEGYMCHSDTTYDRGTNNSGVQANESALTPFRVEHLEVWVEHNVEALEEQERLGSRDEHFTKDRRKVNLQHFFKNDFDREYILGKNAKTNPN